MGIMDGDEPMMQLRNQGIILGEDSEKMSKSRGNVISPDALVDQFGADVVRAYLMFFARWELGAPWNNQGIEGSARWLRRVWALVTNSVDQPVLIDKPGDAVGRNLRRKLHQILKQVSHDFEHFEFNTIISGLMELLNDMYRARELGLIGTPVWEEAIDIYIKMLAPVAPHIAEELWERIGNDYSIHLQDWPAVDEDAIVKETITLIVQVNGKLRDKVILPVNISETEAKQIALSAQGVAKYLEGAEPKKVIYVPGKLVNIVV
jgi:leucyl-tRNA synthetase